MSKEVFRTVQVGDTVHYLTPQGQNGKGKVVIHAGEHVVVNRGKGQPQVVTAKNYSHHTRGGKVIGALLSNLAQHGANERKAKKAAAALKATNAAAAYKIGEPQMNAAKAFGWVKEDKTDESVALGVVGAGMIAAGAAGLYKNAKPKIKAYFKKKEAMKTGEKYAKQYAKDAAMYVANAKDPKRSKRSQSYHAKRAAEFINRSSAEADKVEKLRKEDSKDMEGAAERVAKTKKHKKKLHEVSTGTLASYVSKAIADRKKAQGGADMARRIHTPDRAAYFVDKMGKRADKRSAGIKKAVAKIASSLPAEPLKAHSDSEGARHGGWSGMESVVNEVSAPGKEEWIKANKQRFIDRYGKEKGLRVLYAKAWKDSKVNEAESAAKARAGERSWAADLASSSPQMSQGTGKKATGHYLVRGGKTLSGPHKPDEAVRAYKGMSDSKGVKIVHVKETHEFDVTHDLLSEAKIKEAAKKAVNLKKKATGNKHVETEPELSLPDRVNTTTLSADEGQDNAKL